jgi:hypothetical protein
MAPQRRRRHDALFQRPATCSSTRGFPTRRSTSIAGAGRTKLTARMPAIDLPIRGDSSISLA